MTAANKVTVLRLFIGVIFFVLLSLAITQEGRTREWLIDGANVLFLLAGVLDVLDGYLARLYNESTPLGRVLDPLVDKIFICGSFVFFIKLPGVEGEVAPWMVVLLVVREFVVQGVRVEVEASGRAFGATSAGKIKTFVQSFTASGCMLYAAHLGKAVYQPTTAALLRALIWLTVISTFVSGIIYLVDAVRLFRSDRSTVR